MTSRRTPGPFTARLRVALLLGAASCTGAIDADAPPDPSSAPPTAGSPRGTAARPASEPTGSGASRPAQGPGGAPSSTGASSALPPGACRVAAPLRRLGEVQYANAVR